MYRYNGIGEVAVTAADENAFWGSVCKYMENDTVCLPETGEVFHGVCIWQKNGKATVQVEGFVTQEYTGDVSPAVGYCELVSDGMGGVMVENGVAGNRSRLVVSVDETNKTVTFLL